MTAVAGQLDLFAELDEINDPRPLVTCPHCHGEWRKAVHLTEAEALEVHTGPAHNSTESFHIPVMGKCVSQSYSLCLVAIRADAVRRGDTLPTYRTGFDLLGCILRAKRDGCPEAVINQTITEAGGN